MPILENEISQTGNAFLTNAEQRQSDGAREAIISRFGRDPFVFTGDTEGTEGSGAAPTKEDPLSAVREVFAESPITQVAGGVRDAISSTLNVPTDIINFFKDINTKGIGDFIPEIPKSDSATLGVLRSAAQFLTDFAPAMIGIGAIKTVTKLAAKAPKLAKTIKGEVAGAVAGAAAFDPDDPNLSNLINGLIPALKNPVTEFLATDPEDEAAFNRLKNAVEGLGLGGVTEGFLGAFRAIRSAKGVGKGAVKETPIPKVETPGETKAIPQLQITGDESSKQFNQKIKEFQGLQRKRIEAKRGKRPLTKTQDAADMLGLTPDDLKDIKEGTAFNAEQIVATANVVRNMLDETEALAKRVLEGDAAATADFLRNADTLGVIDPKLFGVRGESGRALQAQRLNTDVIERLENITEGLTKRTGEEVTPEAFAGMFLTLMKETTPKQTAKWLRIAKRVPGMIIETWISMLLTGVKTHMVNFMGNMSTLFMAPLERGVAARIPNSMVAKGESTAMLYGMVMAFSDAVRMAGRTLKTGVADDVALRKASKLEGFERKITAEAFELDKSGIAGKAVDLVGSVTTFPLRALLASDVMFKHVNRKAQLHALAVREAFERGLKGDEAGKFIDELVINPDPGAIKAAEQFASYQTFTNDLGKFGTAVQDFANSHMLVKFFMPFVRTPVNIFKYSFERTPIGGMIESVQQTLKGTNTAERDLAVARLALGSMATVTIASFAGAGHITGSGPANPKLRNQMKELGWQPNSVLAGDTYVSYNRFDPVGMMIGQVADFVESSAYLDHDEAEQVAVGIAVAFSRNMMSKTYITGMQHLMDIVTVGTSSGDLGLSFSQARTALKGMQLSFIPTIVRDYQKAIDPVLREQDAWGKMWKANIPYFSKDVFAERNVFGDEVLRNTSFTSIANPLYITHKKDDPAMEELVRRDVAVSAIPDWIAGKKPRFLGKEEVDQGIKLTEEQQDFWKLEAGRGLRNDITKLMEDKNYRFKMTDFEKHESLVSLVREHRQMALSVMIKDFGLEQEVREKLQDIDESRQVISDLLDGG